MKLCQRCGHAILPGEGYNTYDKFSTSGAGITIYGHKRYCKTPPRPAPAPRRR